MRRTDFYLVPILSAQFTTCFMCFTVRKLLKRTLNINIYYSKSNFTAGEEFYQKFNNFPLLQSSFGEVVNESQSLSTA